MFENPDLSVESLPEAASLEWQPLAPRYVRRRQVEALVAVLVATVVGGGFQVLGPDVRFLMPLLWSAIGIALLAGIAWPVVAVPRKGYAIRERDLLYRTGVLWRAEHAIPFNRVQHVETGSKPLDRVFGLKSLHLHTAGASGSDLQIHGLPADVAERLRRFVLEQAGVDVDG